MGGGCSGLVMNFHDLPIWVMVTYHVLSGFFLFLFLVILEIEVLRENCALGGMCGRIT